MGLPGAYVGVEFASNFGAAKHKLGLWLYGSQHLIRSQLAHIARLGGLNALN